MLTIAKSPIVRGAALRDCASHDGDPPPTCAEGEIMAALLIAFMISNPTCARSRPIDDPAPVVAKGDERLVQARIAQSREIAIGADHLHAQYRPWGRIGIDQSDDTIATLRLDQLDNHLRMAAGANNDNRLNAHVTRWVSHFKPCFRSPLIAWVRACGAVVRR